MKEYKIELIAPPNGAVDAINAMDKWQRYELGRKTYQFVRRMMRNPEYREKIQALAEQIREENAAQEPPVELEMAAY